MTFLGAVLVGLGTEASVGSTPAILQESPHHLLLLMLSKKRKKLLGKRGCSPTPRTARHGDQCRVRPRSVHSLVLASQQSVPLTLALTQALLSPVPDNLSALEGQHGASTISVPSTPEAFTAARDLFLPLVLP